MNDMKRTTTTLFSVKKKKKAVTWNGSNTFLIRGLLGRLGITNSLKHVYDRLNSYQDFSLSNILGYGTDTAFWSESTLDKNTTIYILSTYLIKFPLSRISWRLVSSRTSDDSEFCFNVLPEGYSQNKRLSWEESHGHFNCRDSVRRENVQLR